MSARPRIENAAVISQGVQGPNPLLDQMFRLILVDRHGTPAEFDMDAATLAALGLSVQAAEGILRSAFEDQFPGVLDTLIDKHAGTDE